jgi:MFS family permease
MIAASSSADPRLSVFNRRDFRMYLGALCLATLAGQIESVAVAWQVYDLRRSPLALGYVGLSQFIPMAVFAFPAGDLADRLDRRMILTVSYLVQAVGAALLLVLTLAKPTGIWPFYAVLALFGTARAFGQPASQSFLPLLIPGDQFPEAIAWTSSARQMATVAGPAIGGALYLFGPIVPYGACLALFLVVSVSITSLHTRSVSHAPQHGLTAFQRVTLGLRYVQAQSVILGVISLDLFAVLLGGVTALLPIYARDILQVGPTGLGLLRSAPAAGAALTGLMLGHIPPRRNTGLTMFACVAIFGVATIVFGLSQSFALSLAALLVLGASDMVSVYVRATLIQLATPDAMRGRVSALNSLFIGASNELGGFESGVTAAWFGTVPSVVIGGLGTIAVVALWMWLFPSLRGVDRISEVTPSLE